MSSTQVVQEVTVQRHHNGLSHQEEVDLTEQRRNHNLQSAMPAGTRHTTATIKFAITSNSRIIQEERNVLTATGSTSLRIVRKYMEELKFQKTECECE